MKPNFSLEYNKTTMTTSTMRTTMRAQEISYYSMYRVSVCVYYKVDEKPVKLIIIGQWKLHKVCRDLPRSSTLEMDEYHEQIHSICFSIQSKCQNDPLSSSFFQTHTQTEINTNSHTSCTYCIESFNFFSCVPRRGRRRSK